MGILTNPSFFSRILRRCMCPNGTLALAKPCKSYSHLFMHFTIPFLQHNDTIPETVTAVPEDGFFRKYRNMAIFLRVFYILRMAVLPWCGASLMSFLVGM